MPKVTKTPVPKKRYHGSRWRIYWHYKNQQYVVQTDYYKLDDEFMVDQDLRHISSALAMEEPVFPPQYADLPAIRQYLDKRFPNRPKVEIPTTETILADYDRAYSAEVGKEWAQNSRRRLNQLTAVANGNILDVTPKMAKDFLSDILLKGRKPGTRNRALNVFTRFFGEMVRFGYVAESPFKGIKLLKEPKEEVIVYCTRSERARLINMARKSGMPDWIAVPIAFFTGMRMEEVFRFEWSDINWESERLIVRKTKKRKKRPVDLSPKLRAMLLLTPEKDRKGFVVPEVEGVKSRRDRAQTIARILRKIAAKESDPIPSERIGWNPWRHTFATYLVQAGVPIETVAELIGNTPEVCRQHYSQAIPREKRIAAIDKL